MHTELTIGGGGSGGGGDVNCSPSNLKSFTFVISKNIERDCRFGLWAEKVLFVNTMSSKSIS